jgi:hypothetical protein
MRFLYLEFIEHLKLTFRIWEKYAFCHLYFGQYANICTPAQLYLYLYLNIELAEFKLLELQIIFMLNVASQVQISIIYEIDLIQIKQYEIPESGSIFA